MRKVLLVLLLLPGILCLVAPAHGQMVMQIPYTFYGYVETYGWLTYGYDYPAGIAVDNSGYVYVSQDDISANVIRVDMFGNTQTVAGVYGNNSFGGDGGPATNAYLNSPMGIALDMRGNIFIADMGNNRVRKVDANGIITTFAGNSPPVSVGDGGPATAAMLNSPVSVASDKWGNVFIAESGINRIRKVDTNGIITTIAGNGIPGYSGDGGPATSASINVGTQLTVDTSGNLYFYDLRVRKISPDGIITAIAGTGTSGFGGDGGPALDAGIGTTYFDGFDPPWGGIVADRFGNVYISDAYNGKIRKISGGIINSVAGSTSYNYATVGLAMNETITGGNLATDSLGNIFYNDYYAFTVNKITFGDDASPGVLYGNYFQLSVCANDSGKSLDDFLSIYDQAGLTEVWSVSSPAMHGTVVCADTVIATDSLVTPAGISYSPLSGYVGMDSFKIKVNNGTGTSIVTILIEVLPIITPGSIIGDSIVCFSDSVFVKYYDTIPSSGGVWSGVSLLPVSSDTVILMPTVLEPDLIHFTNGCGTASKIVTISAVPHFLQNTLCIGDTISLPISEYALTSWTSSNDHLSINSSGLITGITNGIDTLRLTNNNGCTQSIGFVVGPPVYPLDVANNCAGTGSAFYHLDSESWVSTNIYVAPVFDFYPGQTTYINFDSSGVTTLIGSNICGSSYTSVAVVARVTGLSVPEIICAGVSTTLSATPGGGTWYSSGIGVSIDSFGSVSVTNNLPQYVTVTYESPNGCYAYTYTTIDSAPAEIPFLDSVVCEGEPLEVPGYYFEYPVSLTCSQPAAEETGSDYGDITSVVGLVAGNATFTLTNGCGTVSKVVTINPVPSSILVVPNLCLGSTVTASDTTTGGVWSTSFGKVTVDSSGTVFALSGPADLVLYTLPNGCYASAPVTVTPTIPTAITGDSVFCAGQFLNLTDSVPGGAWVSSNAGIVTDSLYALGAGTVTITYQNGCGSTFRTITINMLPDPIIGVDSMCQGGSTVFYDATMGGSWSTPSPNTITDSGVFTANVGGALAISYTLPTGCSQVFDELVDPQPNIIVSDSVLCGIGTSYLGVIIGATSFWVPDGIWSSSDSAVAIVNSLQQIVGLEAGTAIITYRETGICNTLFATQSITVYPLPSSHDTALNICAGPDHAITISLPDTIGVWNLANSTAELLDSGLHTKIVRGITVGTDTILFTKTTRCGVTTYRYAVTVRSDVVAGQITGDTLLCAGGHVTLSDTTAGGTWMTYSPGITTVSLEGVVTGHAAGAAVIVYSGTNSCGAYLQQKTVTVVDTLLPVPVVTGPDSLCAGSINTFATSSSGGIWASASAIATIDSSGNLIATLPGVDSIFYSVSNLCGISRAIHIVTIDPLPNAGIITGPDSICTGTETHFNVSASGGIWTGGGPYTEWGAPGNVTALIGGYDTIQYVITTFCGTSVAEKVIKVDTLGVPGFITGNDTVCVNAVTTLSDTLASGAWVSLEGNVSVSSGVVQGVSAGLDTVVLIVTDACGSDSTSHALMVSPLPNAGVIVGMDSICMGTSTYFHDSVPGGIWTSFSANVEVSGNLVTAEINGWDTVYYSVANSCGVAVVEQPVYVNTIPVALPIMGQSVVCLGQTATLTDSAGSGNWFAMNTNASVADGVLTGLAKGIDTILFITGNICGNDTANKMITISSVVATSITGRSYVCPLVNDTLTLDPPGGVVSSLKGLVDVLLGGVVSEVGTGVDTIVYKYTNSCGTDSFSYPIYAFTQWQCDSVTAVPDINGVTMDGPLVYPNPTTGGFIVSVPGNSGLLEMSVSDLFGQSVSPGFSTNGKQIEADLSAVPRGVYLLRIKAGKQVYVARVVLW